MLNVSIKPHRTFLRAGDAAAQKLFVLLQIAPARDLMTSRAPLVVALVLDTSLSMRAFVDQEAASLLAAQGRNATGTSTDGAHYRSLDATLPTLLDRAIEAAHALVDDARLRSDDLFSIVHFDDQTRALWPLAPLQNKAAIHAAIEKLRGCAGQTQMGKGLECALGEMRKFPDAASRRVFVFTDGATSDEEKCRALASGFLGLNAPIVALGFGPEYNVELMKHLADETGGRPYHLRKIEQLRAILDSEIGQSAREIVTDLRLQIKAVKGARLERAHRVFPALGEISVGEKSGELRMGNLASGENTAFLLEFTLEGLTRAESRARIAQLQLTARVPGNEMHGTSTQLHVLPIEDVIVEFTRDENLLARTDSEVLGYVGQRNVGVLAESAAQSAPRDAETARRNLQAAVVLASKAGNAPATAMLQSALDELERDGEISPDTRRTVALGVRTHTVSPGAPHDSNVARGGLSDDEIRRLSGT